MSLDVAPTREEGLEEVLSDEALDFVSELHARFEPRRREQRAVALVQALCARVPGPPIITRYRPASHVSVSGETSR